MKIGLIVAMQKEFKAIESLLESSQKIETTTYEYITGKIGNNEIILMQCGIGKVNAAMGTENMLNLFSPHLVVSTGVAGGIGKDLQVMDIVISSRLAYYDVFCGEENQFGQVQGMPAQFSSPVSMVKKAKQLNYTNKIHSGLVVTGDWFVTQKEKVLNILSHFPGALAVDMESAAIAQVCFIRRIPFCSLRIISDTPLNNDSLNQYKDFWKTLADKSFNFTKLFLENLD